MRSTNSRTAEAESASPFLHGLALSHAGFIAFPLLSNIECIKPAPSVGDPALQLVRAMNLKSRCSLVIRLLELSERVESD